MWAMTIDGTTHNLICVGVLTREAELELSGVALALPRLLRVSGNAAAEDQPFGATDYEFWFSSQENLDLFVGDPQGGGAACSGESPDSNHVRVVAAACVVPMHRIRNGCRPAL